MLPPSCRLRLARICVLGGIAWVLAGPGIHDSAWGSEKESEAHGSSHGSGEGSKTSSKDHAYLHLKPLVVSVLKENTPQQIVALQVDLVPRNFEASVKLQDNLLRIQDALFSAAYTGLSDGSLYAGPTVDLLKIKARFGEALNKLLGAGLVEAVLIQSVSQRKL